MKLVFERATFAEILNDIEAVLGARVQTVQNGTEKYSFPMSEEVSLASVAIGATTKLGPEPQGSSPEGPEPTPEAAVTSPPNSKITPPKKAKAIKPEPKPEPKVAAKPTAPAKAAPSVLDAEPEPDVEDAGEKEDTVVVTGPAGLANLAAIREKTIEDLQQAYSNGQQKEVFALLSKYGNGAKSFRELPADAFVPIRKAIDAGALT